MRSGIWVGIVTILVGLSPSAQASIEAQALVKGQSVTVSTDYDIGDAAVADPAVCDFLVGQDRRSLYVNARGGGETSMTLWDVKGNKRDAFPVRVVTATLAETLTRARDTVGALPGVNVETRDGKVVVTGEVAEPEDFRSIEALGKTDPRLRSRIRLSRDVIDKAAQAVREAIGVPGIAVRSVRDRIVLEGVAYSEADAKRALEIARLYTSDVLDLIEIKSTGRTIGRGRMIELEFHLMEVKREALRELGLSWTPGAFVGSSSGNASVGGGGILSAVGDFGKSLLGFVLGFVPRLKLLRERGDARVLENPKVIVKSGEEARIFSGSEVPFLNGEEVQFKKVGVDIIATPIESPAGIDIKFSATLSAPSSDIRGAVDTHTMSTSAVCPEGQSIVVGGIVRHGDVKMHNRAPRGTETDSAIFTLFLSKDFQSNRSEFVLVVTPRIVEQPKPAELELQAFFATQDAIVRDRSRKEFEEDGRHKSKRSDVENIEDDRPKGARHSGRRWR